MCMHCMCLIYTTCDSVISELPRYQMTPSTFLMSVSSASLSPRSKSTVRRAASCGHDDNATSRATSCSMMAEEPLPPKLASTTSFRCKDGRSARPHHGCWFDPQIGQEQGKYGMQMDLKWFEKCRQNDENSHILVFQGQPCGIHVPTHPKTAKWNRHTHFELQYVLGTALAANQQPAISTERNASSLHRIENQCASNERFTEVGTFAALMWSSLLLGHLFEPKARNNNHQFGSNFSIPNSFKENTQIGYYQRKNKNQQGQHWQQNCNTNTGHQLCDL